MEDLEKYIESKKENKIRTMSFIDYLYFLMKEKNLESTDIYNKVDIDRRVWSKIISNKMKPLLNMVVKIAFGLRCNNEECKLLLKKLNYTLSSSSEFSLVIRYCIENEIYNIIDVNNLLYEKGLPIL